MTIGIIAAAPPSLILDTDICTDAGDIGVLQVAIALHKAKECLLDTVVTNGSNLYCAPCVKAILHVNGLDSVGIGAYMGNDMDSTSPFNQQITSRFNANPSDTRANYTDATTLLRQKLAGAPNNHFVYASVGFGVNLNNLLNSTADGISSLTGSQLIAQKMRGIFIMGGDYASGNEYNFNHSPAAWNNFFANKPAVPTYLWGFTPPNTVNSGPANNGGATVSPSYYGYDLETGGAPGTRPSWDQFAVLSAVRGPEYSLFQIVGKNGSNSVNASTGANTWTSTVGNDSYMGKVASDATIQTTLNNLMAGVL